MREETWFKCYLADFPDVKHRVGRVTFAITDKRARRIKGGSGGWMLTSYQTHLSPSELPKRFSKTKKEAIERYLKGMADRADRLEDEARELRAEIPKAAADLEGAAP